MNLIDRKNKTWNTFRVHYSPHYIFLRTQNSHKRRLVIVPTTYEHHSFPLLMGTFSGACSLMVGTEKKGKVWHFVPRSQSQMTSSYRYTCWRNKCKSWRVRVPECTLESWSQSVMIVQWAQLTFSGLLLLSQGLTSFLPPFCSQKRRRRKATMGKRLKKQKHFSHKTMYVRAELFT